MLKAHRLCLCIKSVYRTIFSIWTLYGTIMWTCVSRVLLLMNKYGTFFPGTFTNEQARYVDIHNMILKRAFRISVQLILTFPISVVKSNVLLNILSGIFCSHT